MNLCDVDGVLKQRKLCVQVEKIFDLQSHFANFEQKLSDISFLCISSKNKSVIVHISQYTELKLN